MLVMKNVRRVATCITYMSTRERDTHTVHPSWDVDVCMQETTYHTTVCDDRPARAPHPISICNPVIVVLVVEMRPTSMSA